MYKYLFIFLLPFLFFGQSPNESNGNTANVSVEKALFGFGIGLTDASLETQLRVSRLVSMKIDFGLEQGLVFGGSPPTTIYNASPKIGAEPRWYYNLDKRNQKSKSVKNNAGNFVGLNVIYIPDWFLINLGTPLGANSLTFMPNWGIRRTIGESPFFWEVGASVGYGFNFIRNDWGPDGFINLKIGIFKSIK